MESILSIQNLSIKIDDRTLMQNVSFDINEGEAVLLSGANGAGKSTLLKAILGLELSDKQINGTIIKRGFENVLSLSSSELLQYRSQIAYIQQKDEYSEMNGVLVRDIISNSAEAHLGKSLSNAEVDDIIDEWIPRREDNTRIFHAKSKPGKFSGGEQRLLSVLSILATRSDSNLLVIDEPLNNLDFVNAKSISNMINKAIHDNQSMALLMISHCRIFPFITREIKLESKTISTVPNHYVCHSCIGEPNAEGYYD